MHTICRSFEEWRTSVRPMLAAGIAPNEAAQRGLLDAPSAVMHDRTLRMPRTLMQLLENLACYREPGRWELMYRLAWRSLFENPRLLEDAADPDVSNAQLMDRAVRRDLHKMHAFVRFREVDGADDAESYFAWFEPDHEILRKGANFFVKRFPNMVWTIATPDGAALWDGKSLRFLDSPDPADRPQRDAHEDLWRTYYGSICNVSRINPAAMQREMPQKYWRNLPEATQIRSLIRDGAANFSNQHKVSDDRLDIAKGVKNALDHLSLPEQGLQACRRCDLWQHATQAVTGEGPSDAQIMLVGEQPGDEEDLRGRPFVGPAGKVLAESMAAAGLERHHVFITNAVKHFKWEPRGKPRLHKKADLREMAACSIWLEQEITSIKPRVIVALGATALRALVGASLTIDAARRQHLTHVQGARIVASYHPSAILRADDERARQLRIMLIDDLRCALAGPEVRASGDTPRSVPG